MIFNRKNAILEAEATVRNAGSGTARTNILNLRAEKIDIQNNPASQVLNGFAKNPYIYGAVTLKADSGSAVPLIVKDFEGNEHKKTHNLVKLLSRPNPYTTGYAFREAVLTWLSIAGEAYIYLVPNVYMKQVGIKEMYVLRNDLVNTVQSNDRWEPVQYYEYSNVAGTLRIEPRQMIHIKLYNPLDDLHGFSPLMPIAESAQQNRDARRWNSKLLQNNARPSGFVIVEEELDDDEFNRFKGEIRQTLAGMSNAGLPGLLEGGAKWQQAGMTNVDMDFENMAVISAREIAVGTRVPPEKLGDSKNKTYNNAKEANEAFAYDSLIPLLRKLCEALTAGLAWEFYDDVEIITFDQEKMDALSETNKERADTAVALVNAGIISVNEARDMAGWGKYEPPKKDASPADQLRFPMGSLTIEDATSPIPRIGSGLLGLGGTDADVVDDENN